MTYHEPKKQLTVEKGLIGKRIRVYWVVQANWYEGTITKYHMRTKRHRVEYDDTDHEWVHIEAERDRVQIQLDDGSWVMYLLYRPPELLEDWKRIEEKRRTENYKEQAFADARQWSLISDDRSSMEKMFISEKTGEIRAGTIDADQWVVQEDDHGFPCFYHMTNGNIVYDDPRFVEDEAVSV